MFNLLYQRIVSLLFIYYVFVTTYVTSLHQRKRILRKSCKKKIEKGILNLLCFNIQQLLNITFSISPLIWFF